MAKRKATVALTSLSDLTTEQIAAALARLRLSPRGRLNWREVQPSVYVGLIYAQRGAAHPFAARLEDFEHRRYVGLEVSRSDVRTRSRSQELDRSVWRLTPDAIARLAPTLLIRLRWPDRHELLAPGAIDAWLADNANK